MEHVKRKKNVSVNEVESRKEGKKIKKNKKSFSYILKHEVKNNLVFYLLSLPGLITMLLFSYLPMAGLYIVFERYTYQGGLFGSEFVGLENFRFFFSNIHYALRATRNTIIVNVAGILLGTVFSIALAIMINEINRKWFKKITQSLMILPNFISWIVAGTIFFSLLDEQNGVINKALTGMGLGTVAWYSNPWVWWPILILTGMWKGAGFNSIIYLVSLTGIDPAYYEAASIDGASKGQKIFRITIPLLKPTIIIMFLLSIGGILSGDLGQVLGLTNLNPLLLETADNINTFVYRSAVRAGQFEQASAVQLYQSLFGFLLVMFSNFLVKKYDPEYSLF